MKISLVLLALALAAKPFAGVQAQTGQPTYYPTYFPTDASTKASKSKAPTYYPTYFPTDASTKASKSKAPTGGSLQINSGTITSAQLASTSTSTQQTNKSILSFLVAATAIAAAAALLNLALSWKLARQNSRQAVEDGAADNFEEDESNEQLRDVIVGEGADIVETH